MEYMDETTLAHKHTSPWLIAFRIIFTIALVWCILFIFHNSLETSSISSARSHEVMQKINAILAHLNIGPLSEHVVRKLAHFSEYAVLGGLYAAAIRLSLNGRSGRGAAALRTGLPLLLGLAYAAGDEWHQAFVPGRGPAVRDVLIDFAGVLAGTLLVLAAAALCRRRRR